MTLVQLTRPVPLGRSYLMLSLDDHDKVDKGFELLPQIFLLIRNVCTSRCWEETINPFEIFTALC